MRRSWTRGTGGRASGFALGALAAGLVACGGGDGGRPAPKVELPPLSSLRPPNVDPGTPRGDAVQAGLGPLRGVVLPRPGGDIQSLTAAVALGKALFWDTAVGSDGQTACGTCHFSAGADARLVNVVHPGPNGKFETDGVTGPGETLLSLPRITSDDRIGSTGAYPAAFVSASPTGEDSCVPGKAPPFGAFRQVTDRNAPSAIGAVLYREQFWDGRGADVFNGHDAFGDTANAGPAIGEPLAGASLASQAVGPPVNDGEMSCAGRAFNGADGLAGRLLGRPALASQQVSPTDSVLGPGSAYPGNGLRCGAGSCTYRDLFAAAFGAERAAAAEATFSRLFGQAVAAYESTLVPDDTPFDRWIAGDDAALTATQQFGVQVFVGKAGCAACHAGPELTDASPSYFAAHGPTGEFGNDTGYHNIGVTATEDDLGRARLGPKGVSYSRSGSPLDRGAFKTPGLRNVALTAPYFHNGGSPTLQAVMNFYDRGGDHENVELSPRVQMLGLQPDEFQAVVDLLQNGLTDCRVATQKAPFDHPSIDIAGGPRLPAVGAEGTGPCP